MKKILSIICSVFVTTVSPAISADLVPFGGEKLENLVAPYAIVVADNQYTADHGGSIIEQAYKVNKITPSARRSAANSMFSLSLMEEVIAREKGLAAKLVIHVGDGMNNGCASEWDALSKSLNKAGLPWFLTPGNHDAFYLGISNPRVDQRGPDTLLDSAIGWGHLCRPHRAADGYRSGFDINQEPRFIFTKRELIKAYLMELEQREPFDPERNSFDPKGLVQLKSGVTCHLKPNIRFLHRVCWYHNDDETYWGRREPWGDFIVQELRWSYSGGKTVSVILMDTSDYPQRQKLAQFCSDDFWKGQSCYRLGGIHASLGAKQRKLLNTWLKENKDRGIKTVLSGHHPFRKMEDGVELLVVNGETRSWLETAAKNTRASTLISAHTHNGYVVGKRYGRLSEFNVGSLVDAPIHYMRMNWGQSNAGLAPRLSSIYLTEVSPNHSKVSGYEDKQLVPRCESIVIDETEVPKSLLATLDETAIKVSSSRWRSLLSRRDSDGIGSQLSSFLQEARLYSKVLAHKGEAEMVKPVCYRVDDHRCYSKPFAAFCASADDVARCDAEDLETERFADMTSLASNNDAVDLARVIEKELSGLVGRKIAKGKAIKLRWNVARKLEAIRIFDDINHANDVEKYRMVKACISLLSSHER